MKHRNHMRKGHMPKIHAVEHEMKRVTHFHGRPSRIRRILIADEEDYTKVYIALPGIEKSSLKIRVNNEQIIFSAKIKEEIARLQRQDKYEGRIPLMDHVDKDSVKATYEDGILYLTLKKVETGKIIEVE